MFFLLFVKKVKNFLFLETAVTVLFFLRGTLGSGSFRCNKSTSSWSGHKVGGLINMALIQLHTTSKLYETIIQHPQTLEV